MKKRGKLTGLVMTAAIALSGLYYINSNENIIAQNDALYTAAEESEEQRQRALAAAYLACGGEPVSETVDILGQGEQVIYTVHLSYRVRIAVNMG